MSRGSPAREGTRPHERICLDQRYPNSLREKRIGGGDGSAPAFNEDHPLFRAIREMISVRKKNPTLQSGIQIVRYAEDKPGIFAVSRIDPKRREEMLVVFNNSSGNAAKRISKSFRRPAIGNGSLIPAPKESASVPVPIRQLSIELGALVELWYCAIRSRSRPGRNHQASCIWR